MKPSAAAALSLVFSFSAVVLGQPATGARAISADLLRQPLSPKAKRILQKAQRAADGGDHFGAIDLLETARDKYPESDAWTQSMLGVEYLRTNQFAAAVTSLEKAVLLLPRDATDRSNLGLALAFTGQYERAERELTRAVALDSDDSKTRQLLDIVLRRRSPQTPAAQ